MKNYSNEIAAVIKCFLDEDNWHYSFDKEDGSFRFGVTGHSSLKNIRYSINVYKGEYVVYACSPIGANPDDHNQMKHLNCSPVSSPAWESIWMNRIQARARMCLWMTLNRMSEQYCLILMRKGVRRNDRCSPQDICRMQLDPD